MNAERLARAAALGAVALGLLLAIVDRGPAGTAVGVPSAPAAAWAEEVERAGDHLTAEALVALLEQDRSKAVLVDLRPEAEYRAFHLLDSVHLSLPRLLGAEGAALLAGHPGATVVLLSNGMTHPGQAWTELARRGHRNVRILEDGIDGLRSGLLAPPSLRGPTTETGARAAHGAYAAANRVLLGRFVPPPPALAARLATDPATLERPTIVSTAWVAAHRGDVVVLDTREKAEDFAKGHVPGALHLPITATRGTRNGVPEELLEPAALAAAFGRLGIGPETGVVAYAEEKLQDATHAALALVTLGHRRLAVMEGGLGAWRAEGRPVETGPSAAREPVAYVPAADAPSFGVDLDAVSLASRTGRPAILDVRPGDAFRGDVSTEARPGHIPGSMNRDHRIDLASREGGTWWRPVEELRAEYAALGLAPSDPVVVTCRTGHQATQTWFTMKYLLGFEDVRWYDGSWKEWAARREMPTELGRPKVHAP